MQQCIQPRQDIQLSPDSLQAQAQRDWNRPDVSAGVDRISQKDVASKQLRPDISRLLTQLDQRAADSKPETSVIAAQDQLFLAYNARGMTRFKSVDELRHIYDLTFLLLARLLSFLASASRRSWPLQTSPSASGILDGEKSIADLDHILRWLRHAAVEALIYHGLSSFEDVVQQWHQHWLQKRQLNLGWFLEWPGGRRPLSTTWPWNIKPSLVVLWGVCWMFYDNSTRSAQNWRQLENEIEPSSFWARHTPQSATSGQQNITTSLIPGQSFQQAEGGGGINTRRANRTPEYNTTSLGYQSSHPTNSSPYISSCFFDSPDPTSDPPPTWPQNQGSYSCPVFPRNPGNRPSQTFPPAHRHTAPSSIALFGLDYNFGQEPPFHQPQPGQRQPQRSAPNPRRIEPSGGAQPYAPFLQQATSQGDDRAAAAFSPSLRLPMGHIPNYQSPHSDVSRDETKSSSFSVLPSNDLSPDMMFAASASAQSHHSPSSTGKKGEEAPRNAHGQITCNHPKCVSNPPVFSRRCEWTKHMDKHTRPYVCNIPGCVRGGFTYSAGLSRHQREVHRQYGGPKASYMCPHKDCKRSTGSGFSRKENLQEHVRRVHRQLGEAEVEKQAPIEAPSLAATEPRRRRRRIHDDDDDDDAAEPVLREPRKRKRNEEDEGKENSNESQSSGEDLATQVKRLRKELREKDERLRKLEQTVELLTKRLS
ncbi:MAG: hypothetical protein LQ338_007588 [Usnochroma carphineum]|nr:MAG: hypothetical protein LQ338_007588 [Usnochroma carphineum]